MNPNALQHSPIAHRLDPQVRQAMGRLPVEVVGKLSETEMLALYHSISRPRDHSLDLRLSLPLLSNRLYFVTLVGVERRSRIQQNPEPSGPGSAGHFCFALMMTLLAGFMVGGFGYRLMNQQAQVAAQLAASEVVEEVVETVEPEIYPAVLPEISNATRCEGPSRQWENGLCYEQVQVYQTRF